MTTHTESIPEGIFSKETLFCSRIESTFLQKPSSVFIIAFSIEITVKFFLPAIPVSVLLEEDVYKRQVQNYSNGSSGIPVYLTIIDVLGTGNLDFMFEYNLAMASEEIVDKLYSQMIKSIEIGIASPNKTLREIISEI